MRVIVTGRNRHVSDDLKELATQKLEKVQRFFGRIQTLEIEFSEEHNPRISDKHTVEVILTTKAHVLRAHASAPDAPTAIDRVVGKLQRQVRRLKEKIVDRGHGASRAAKGSAGRATSIRTAPQRAPRPRPPTVGMGGNGLQVGLESPDTEGGGTRRPLIAEVKRFAVKPMTAEEAVLQMESLGRDFYLFLNAESEQAGVVYRRPDGTFGLIEPD